jgi:superfamily II DNA or RNA helicase
MKTLRPYQIEAINELRDGFKNHKRQILALTTGAGKTVIFSEMVRLAALRGTQTLVLTNRIELFQQTIKTLQIEAQGLNANSRCFDPLANVTVAMVETLKRRLPDGFNPHLIICDEAHNAAFNKVLDTYPDAFVIGATATPLGKHIYKYYSNIVQTVDTPELIEMGYLSPCRAYQMVDDFSDLEVKAGEYTEKSLFNHFNDRKLYGGVIEQWQQRANGKKTLIFNVNIEHSQNMTQAFRDAGIVSECITSKTPKHERENILRAFSQGLFPVLNNCGILTTGYDEPTIDCIVMNRKTLSLPLWLQCCGRGSRIAPNKSEFILLDFGMNHDVHGLWAEPRQWTLKPPKKKRSNAEREMPAKTCPDCDAMLHAAARVCKFCGHEFPVQDAAPADGKMVEVSAGHLEGKRIADLTLDELAQLQKSKKAKATMVWRVVRSKGKQSVADYAAIVGYTKGWVYHQLQKMNDCNFTNIIIR